MGTSITSTAIEVITGIIVHWQSLKENPTIHAIALPILLCQSRCPHALLARLLPQSWPRRVLHRILGCRQAINHLLSSTIMGNPLRSIQQPRLNIAIHIRNKFDAAITRGNEFQPELSNCDRVCGSYSQCTGQIID